MPRRKPEPTFEERIAKSAAKYIEAISEDYPGDESAQYAVVRQILLIKESEQPVQVRSIDAIMSSEPSERRAA